MAAAEAQLPRDERLFYYPPMHAKEYVRLAQHGQEARRREILRTGMGVVLQGENPEKRQSDAEDNGEG
jgi:hypothetical protein